MKENGQRGIHGSILVMCMLVAVWAVSVGCMSNFESASADVSPKGWEAPAEMVYTNRDTLSKRMASLFLRHDSKMSSGRYAVEFRAPSGKIASRDTVWVEIPQRHSFSIPPSMSISVSANWRLSYFGRIGLAEEGDYLVTITPLQITAGVWSVGIVLNKSE